MVMKKICLLLVGVLALFSCEQEELGDFIDNDLTQLQTRRDSKTVTKTRTGQIPIQPGETVKLDAVLIMYKGSLTYVATLRKIGDTKTFRVKGKWSGDCFSFFKARTYNPTTGKLVGEYVLE